MPDSADFASSNAIELPPTEPSVSIVIAAFNCAQTIGATLDSCLGQRYQNFEVLVVNDGSRDGTARVLDTYGERIKVLTKPNGGLASARNAGMESASGEFVAWMDADDLMAPERIALQAAVLSANTTVEIVCSDFSAFVNDERDFDSSHIASYYSAVNKLGGIGNILPRQQKVRYMSGTTVVRSGSAYHALLHGSFVHPPTVMTRRSIFERVGFFDETLRYNSDFDLILRTARIGEIAFVDAPLLRYRRSDAQMSHSAAGGRIPLETVAILDKIGRDDPGTFRDNEALMRYRKAELLIDAADVIGPGDRARALGLLWQGVRQKLLLAKAAHALARILVPRPAVAAFKATRTLFRREHN
jgi:glycosyltransferase involved in cell wall biosynthesis